eukprot:scaffold17876_cov77-Skeletonema_dohrnii-CCMP3373.AAC.3
MYMVMDMLSSHFNTAYGSLSREQQEAHDNIRKEKKAELCRRQSTERNAGKRYTDMTHNLCSDKNTGFMFFLPPSKGGGFVCMDWSALTRVTGINSAKGVSAERMLYNVLSLDYGFEPDANMRHPVKPGVKPKLKNHALKGPVVLYHSGFTASSAPPGLSDKKRALKKKNRDKRRDARKARKYDESDESDLSDDDEN